jgi:CBS domain containing-hemolysin-like protein
MWIIVIVIVSILISISAFFSAAEMAFISSRRIRVKKAIEEGNKKAILLESLMKHQDEVVSTIVVCNNLVNICASIIVGYFTTEYFGDIGIGIATGFMTLIVVVFAEAIPKSYGISNYKFAFKSARALQIITIIFSPLSKSLAWFTNIFLRMIGKEKKKRALITEDEIKAMLSIGIEDGTIDKDEKRLIEEIFDFDSTKAKEIYIQLKDIVSISEHDTVKKLKEITVKSGHSRYPVYRNNKDDIVGIVHIKDGLLKDDDTLIHDIMRKIITISPGTRLDTVFGKMQKQKFHMALVKGKDGKFLGIVTLEDLLEEIFGEIHDEHDFA